MLSRRSRIAFRLGSGPERLAVLGALPDLGKSPIAANPDVSGRCSTPRLGVEIDRNDGQIRLKALVSSAVSEAKSK